MERLQKVIANSGYCSRRKAEEFINQGLVTINDEIATLSSTVEDGDIVKLDGKIIEAKEDYVVLAFNKPKGITCTTEHKVKDNIIDYIRENTGKKQIIVASTVYRKLLKLGIKPDFVVVVDPQNRTFGHMVDVDDFSAKLLLNAVGNWKFSEYYKGKKYLIPCAGHECVSEYYKGTDVKMVDTGSSVTVTCAQIATLFGAKRIDLIGLDMSFPGNVSHASGTMDCTVSEREGYPEIECVAGGMVKTKYEYIFYLREVENVISANKNVEFVNYSNGGAAIKGSKWYKNLSN